MVAKDDLQVARKEMLTLLKHGRVKTAFTKKQPTHWSPHTVTDPSTGQPFTSFGCLDFIKNLLENKYPIEVIVLDKPPGAAGYVMKVVPGGGDAEIYIKLQIGPGWLVGRSFHYS